MENSQILVDTMATRKHAKPATTPTTPRNNTTDTTATDTPTATAGTPEQRTTRTPRNTRTNTTTTTTPTTTTTTNSEVASRSQHTLPASASRQRFADSVPTTSTGKKSTESDDTEITKVVVIKTKSEFDKKLEEAGNKLVLVEFFASWCGPCRLLSPKLEELANEYEDKVFVMKMDVDECEEVPMEYGVSSMPTFLFMRNKQKIELFVGSNSEKLIKRLEKLSDPKKVISPAPSTTSQKPSEAKDLKSSPSKKKLRKSKPDAAEDSAAPSTATTSTPTSSSGKKTAAK